tara:strand:- start:211 stop:384 length:174 start_codon:yes stop_codon:yes gene_type:complete
MDDFNLETTLNDMVKQGLITERWNEDEQQFEYAVTELGTRTLVAYEKQAKENKDDPS